MSICKKAMRCVPASRSLLLGVAVISLSACQTIRDLGPDATIIDSKAEIPVQPDWVEPAPDALPSTDWVADFNSKELSLLVDTALEQNTTIGQSLAQLDGALSRIRTSRADLMPNLNFGSTITRSSGGNDFNTDSTSYSLGLNSGWEVDLFGRLRDQVSAAEMGAAASSADLAAARLSIAGQVGQSWFNAIQGDLLVDLSRRDIETQERALRLTQRRFDNGLAGSSDVRLARSSVANAEAVLATRLQNRDVTIRGLKVLLRQYPDSVMDIPNDFPELPVLTGAANPAYLLQKRPDILAAERRIAEAGLNVDVARKSLYPQLNLSGSLTEQALSSANDFDILDLFDLKGIAQRLTAQLTAPLFQGGRIKAQIDGQEAVLRQRVESYVGTVLTAYQEVENALDAEERLAEREDALRESLYEAQKAEERLESRYIEGLATILQLLDAQSRRLNAEGQLIGARAERLNNRVRMNVAIGGGEYGAEVPATDIESDEGLIGKLLSSNQG